MEVLGKCQLKDDYNQEAQLIYEPVGREVVNDSDVDSIAPVYTCQMSETVGRTDGREGPTYLQ
jgi:hypothetical protein